MRDELPSLRSLGDDLLYVSPARVALSLCVPFLIAAAYFALAFRGYWFPAFLCIVYLSFCTYGSISHDLVHRTYHMPRFWNGLVLSAMELLCLRSGFAYRMTHLHHHRAFPQDDDIEGRSGRGPFWKMLLLSPFLQARLWAWSFARTTASGRIILILEAGLAAGYVAFALVMLPRTPVYLVYAALVVGGSWFFPLATVYFPHDPHGTTELTMTRRFRGRGFDIVALGHLYHLEHHLYPAVPHHNWRKLARRLDPHFARLGVQATVLRWPERRGADPRTTAEP